MELRFVATANVSVYYPYSEKARSGPAHYVHGSMARQVDGTFIVLLNCPRISMLLFHRRGREFYRNPLDLRPTVADKVFKWNRRVPRARA